MRYTFTRTNAGYKKGGHLFIAFEIAPENGPRMANGKPWAQGGYTMAPNGKAQLLSATWSNYTEEMDAEDRELVYTVDTHACTELAQLLLTYGQFDLSCTGDDCPEVLLPLATLLRNPIAKPTNL